MKVVVVAIQREYPGYLAVVEEDLVDQRVRVKNRNQPRGRCAVVIGLVPSDTGVLAIAPQRSDVDLQPVPMRRMRTKLRPVSNTDIANAELARIGRCP